MQLNIEHDDMGQKFVTEYEGEECLLAYTVINTTLNLHFMVVPDGQTGKEVAEQLALTAFKYARENGFTISSSSDFIDGFIARHKEFNDLVENE